MPREPHPIEELQVSKNESIGNALGKYIIFLSLIY
jgi:hypothetical protein